MIYFNNAATTYPKPKIVYDQINDFFKYEGINPGRSQDQKTMNTNRRIFDAREKIAHFFSIGDSSRFIFTSGATESLNLVIKGYLKQNDHVVTTKLEHNSVIRPLNKLKEEGRITVSFIDFNEEGIIDLEEIKKAVQKNTALVIISHASNVLGTVNNIKKIAEYCNENDIKILIDAAQTAGALDINLNKLKIDFLSVPGHKSLYGPPGIGGLYIKKGVQLDTLMEGGTGSDSLNTKQPQIMPDKYESGTLNTLGVIGLSAGIEFINEIGREKIYKHEIKLVKKFLIGLENIKDVLIYGTDDLNKKVAVVSINLMNLSANEFAYQLYNNYNISVRAGLHCAPLLHKKMKTDKKGMVRFSFSYFNTLTEIDKALNIIETVSKKRG